MGGIQLDRLIAKSLKTFSSTEAKWHLPCPDKTTGAKTGLPLKQAVAEAPETDPIS